MRIEILGTVSVYVDERERPIRAHKVRALLATLALDAGRSVSNVELADELWSGQPLGNVQNALQAHAARLRKVLDGPKRRPGGETVLRTVQGGYVLDVPGDRVDANRFLELAGQGAAALRVDPRRAVRLLESALRLWRGPALLDAGDGLRCRAGAALYEERRLAVCENLAFARLVVGDAGQAAAELRRLETEHPLHERFCELLMIALYQLGRQGEALHTYHRIRERLDRELGLEPSAPLRARHTEILAQRQVLTLMPTHARAGGPVLAVPAVPAWSRSA
ncbi:AfsR/SARP family transcriptional regulator [Streptomyces actinomycinicus]|uniref:AfsR/SARP family transcriptional regulator n=1 Tax=Streptomyces actinomycinicus TaxID=1695166 RepID=UPI0027DA796B|nr:AfsR/SARP family transcriptional regulator [Streptomyces actinomycinicus]